MCICVYQVLCINCKYESNLFPKSCLISPSITSEVTLYLKTRAKTSIRYAKENDREKREKERERKKGRRRDIEREEN